VVQPTDGAPIEVAGTPDPPFPGVRLFPTAASGPAPCAEPPDGIVAATVSFQGDRKAKVVALTFDDGYDAANTAKILSILTASHVNATFFPVGRAVDREPTVWRSIAAAGFPIGDHTYDHAHLRGRCFDAQRADIERQADVCEDVLGARPVALMRPPYGEFDPVTRLAAAAAGDTNLVLWDVDTRDWTGVSARTIVARATAGTKGSIVLMHTSAHNTALALPRIIAVYRARGYRFVTVGQLLGVPGPVPFPHS
jgi:peptidoglycan/xylan/chitin deacetylase (PgdA/CDA1 family)